MQQGKVQNVTKFFVKGRKPTMFRMTVLQIRKRKLQNLASYNTKNVLAAANGNYGEYEVDLTVMEKKN